VAKRDLQPGEVLDGIGGEAFYSLIDTYETARQEDLLPIGLAKGARVLRAIKQDTPLTCQDVEMKPSTVLDLRRLQDEWFAGRIDEAELLHAIDALAHEPILQPA